MIIMLSRCHLGWLYSLFWAFSAILLPLYALDAEEAEPSVGTGQRAGGRAGYMGG